MCVGVGERIFRCKAYITGTAVVCKLEIQRVSWFRELVKHDREVERLLHDVLRQRRTDFNLFQWPEAVRHEHSKRIEHEAVQLRCERQVERCVRWLRRVHGENSECGWHLQN